MTLHRRSLVAAGASLLAAPALAFPDRPITLIIPFAPGGSAEVLARVLAPAIGEQLGQSVVVDLRPGAGGNIGAGHVATQARADGHTILFASTSLATSVSLTVTNFDPLADLLPVAGLGAIPSLLVVSPQSPHRDLAGLIAAARARPGQISFGSSGPGTGSHLSGELLAAATDTQMLHVPYRGSGAVYPDLIAQRIDFLLDVMGSSAPQVQQGGVRALAVTSAARAASFPDVPTIAEQGVAGFEFATWFGFFVRSGTPPELQRRLEAALIAAREAPPVQERLRQAAALAIPADAAGFAAYFREDAARWSRLVETGRLRRTS
jgi:tripartite-type tricarboxylate transporter receptor subunit TctC